MYIDTLQPAYITVNTLSNQLLNILICVPEIHMFLFPIQDIFIL